MGRFIVRRLGFVILTVLLSSMLVFAATNVLPGDVATMVLGREASQQAKDALRIELGLDRPLVVQYGSWLGDLARGDWGTSLSTQEEVRAVTLERLGGHSETSTVDDPGPFNSYVVSGNGHVLLPGFRTL